MRKIILILFIFLSSFFFSGQASATTIFSPLVELEIEPGRTQAGLVKIFNETDKNLYLVSSVEFFDVDEETGEIFYPLPDEQGSFLEWFEISEDSIVVLPKQVMIVPFEVSVPVNAAPGGYYGVIFWQTAAEPGQEALVGISGKVGTLVFLKIKGDLVEQGEAVEFKAESAGRYFFNLPIDFKISFLNSGNIHLQPRGTVEFKNWLGQTEILQVNAEKRFVLPGKTRQFELVWGDSYNRGDIWRNFWRDLKNEADHLAFGRIKATLRLAYGAEEEKEIIKYLDFWFIPKNLLIFSAGVIVILVILFKINLKVKKIKNAKRK